MSKRTNHYPILENLFNSRIRVKVLRFLFRNYPAGVGTKDLAKKVQETSEDTKKEIGKLEKIGLVKKSGRLLYALNSEFQFFNELASLILKSSPTERDKMIARILGLGRVRLAIVSGVFLNNKDSIDTHESGVDLFIVGDDIDKNKLRIFLKSLEAEVGKEIKFGLMEKEEFEYRYNMFDRFVRVLLEGAHEKLVNKLGL